MKKISIQINNRTKNKISSFGIAGESYDKILQRIYSLAIKEQLRQFYTPSKEFISIQEAIKETNRNCPKK